jgi:Tol biopolymer transport system component
MRKTLILAIFLVLPFLAGCQGFMQPTPAPTLTVVLLASGVKVEPTGTPQAARATALVPVSPPPTPIAQQTVQPTATVASAARIMALGVRPALVLRALPQAGAATVATLPGSQVTWAEGRSPDGRWLRVAYGDTGARAWLALNDVTLLGEVADLPEVGPEAAAASTPAPASAAGIAAKSVPGGRAGRVLADQVNVRRGPGLDQAVIGQAGAGQPVAVVGRSREGDWLAVGWEGGTGWVAARLLELSGNVADLPVLAAQTSVANPPAAAVAVASSGKIVLQTATGGAIYIVNADGSGLRRLTDGIDPALSPDGTRVAFARWDSPHGVFVLDLRTGQEQRIASVNRPRGPTWSSDGARLGFTHVTRTRTCIELGFSCVDPDEVRRMFGGRDCIVTPQGRQCIADFPVVNVDDNGLAVVDLADGARQNLISEGMIQSTQWRPGQNQLLFRGRQGLQTVQPGAQPVPLGDDPNIGSPAWSPDGQRIVAQMRINNRNEIVLLDAAGKVARYLTQPPPTYERPGKPAPNNVAPTWSPDGQSILFLSDRDGIWKLYSMNADGSNQRLFLPNVLDQLSFRYDFAAERMANWGR